MIYFTSDLHLGHKGIISMQNRPFASVEEMNRVIITNYNAVVHKNDTVYILGDICHHMNVEAANEIISKLNGKKILVSGNHDKDYDSSLFDEVCDFKTASLNGIYFAMMHYPMLSWQRKIVEAFMYMGTFTKENLIITKIVKKEFFDLMLAWMPMIFTRCR